MTARISALAASLKPRGADLRHVAHLQQAVDAAQFLQFALDARSRSDRKRPARRPASGCTSGRSCPAALSFRIRSFISRVPIGSSPLVGSSSRISSGSLIKRLGQSDAAGHAFGIFAQLPPLGPIQADHVDQLGRPLRAAPPRACRTAGRRNRASLRRSGSDTDTIPRARSRAARSWRHRWRRGRRPGPGRWSETAARAAA